MKQAILFFVLLIFVSISATAQTKRKPRKIIDKKPVVGAAQTTKIEEPAPLVDDAPHKKNERAADSTVVQPNETVAAPVKKNQAREAAAVDKTAAMPFAYEFAQPKFTIKRVIIEHDERGAGKISFLKQDLDEPLVDPLQISAKSLEKIKALWNELNFLDSTDDYQTPDKDFAHLGTMKLRRESTEKKREAVFNWTDNKAAKDLTDEYKKLTEQFVWIFEMNLARANFPLNSPKMIDNFESLMRRNLISDNEQMLPFLREIADDERLPLIARNHTKKIVERIEKSKEEKK